MHTISERELEELYDEMLDDLYPEVKVGGLTFSPSRIIKELDETAYRIGMQDYADDQELETK